MVCTVVLGIAGSVSVQVSKNELRYVADGCPPMKSKSVAFSQIAGVRDTFYKLHPCSRGLNKGKLL